MLTKNGLKEIGFELIDIMSDFFDVEKSVNLNSAVCYEQINLKNGFYIQSTKKRRGIMPFYIVMFNPQRHYIFELDLSMIIEEADDRYSWNLKNPSNEINRKVYQNMFGNVVKLSAVYVDAVTEQKKEIGSGVNTPRNGIQFVNHVTWYELCEQLCNLMLAILSAHSTVENERIIQAKDGDVNLFKSNEVRVRHGQKLFKRNLIDLYEGRCAISGWSPPDALEAAHIVDYSISGINHTDNGILLRADIHRLFDKQLIKVNPKTLKVHVSNDLKNTGYWIFSNKKISKRKDGKYPSIDLLTAKWS